MKKIERLDYNTSVYPPHIPRLQTVIEKVQELIDAHNELAKIVGLLLKRDEENCLEKAKAELLETHTVKEVCICYQLSRHSKDPEMFCSCQCHGTKEEPTTPEKKCCEKCQRMGRRNETPTVYDVPLPCTSSCPCHQEESEKRNDVY